MSGQLPRVHVLGGGVGGMTAAFHLSAGEWKQRFSSITVYQLGWRLGGKGASGRRNRDGESRIEEHGLHVWFGAYENAFRMLDECHRELDVRELTGKPRWESFCTSVESSFVPIDRVGLMEEAGRSWRPWVARFPRKPGQPWDRDLLHEPAGWSASVIAFDYVEQLVALGRSVIGSLEGGFRAERRRSLEALNAIDAFDWLLSTVARMVHAQRSRITPERAITAAEARDWLDRYGGAIVSALTSADALIDAVGRQLTRLLRNSEEVRRLWAIVDLVLAVARGLMQDRVVDDRALDALDEQEFRDWLVANGSTPESVESPFVRAVVYDLAFAYAGGLGSDPRCGAGTAIRGLHRLLFTYRGALMWKLQGGMGDVVFAPLYELLVKRNVEFKFFHQITDLFTDGRRVTGFEYRRQATQPVEPEQMLVAVDADGRKALCWPATPPVEVNRGTSELESTWYRVDEPQREHTSEDHVVLAISVAALPYVAGELIKASPAWQAMVARLKTVSTETLQLWVGPDAEALGWEQDSIVGGYGKPFDTWSDMPEALSLEAHTNDPVGSLAYFCSVIDLSGIDLDIDPSSPDDVLRSHFTDVTTRARDKLHDDVDFFVTQRLPLLWPGVTVHMVPTDSAHGEASRPRLDIEIDRYERVNVDPTERYVMSVPGSARFRLRPDQSGFGNLYLAGDWTECTINAGCVEAAVISGMTAARAITGEPRQIIGERRERP